MPCCSCCCVHCLLLWTLATALTTSMGVAHETSFSSTGMTLSLDILGFLPKGGRAAAVCWRSKPEPEQRGRWGMAPRFNNPLRIHRRWDQLQLNGRCDEKQERTVHAECLPASLNAPQCDYSPADSSNRHAELRHRLLVGPCAHWKSNSRTGSLSLTLGKEWHDFKAAARLDRWSWVCNARQHNLRCLYDKAVPRGASFKRP